VGDRPAGYTLSRPWTHAPILWAATDEVVPDGGHRDPGSPEGRNVVGGGVSGRW